MEQTKVISANTPEEIWKQIDEDLNKDPELFEYSAVIQCQGRSVILDVDIDLGGGFEGGYALTRFVSNLKSFDDFRFSLHPQDFIDGIGKIFGMQDVTLGYPEFDKMIVVKTNNADRLKDILSDAGVRELIQSLPEFSFHLGHHHLSNDEVESAYIELRIDEGFTNAESLRPIYNAFVSILDKIDMEGSSIIKYL